MSVYMDPETCRDAASAHASFASEAWDLQIYIAFHTFSVDNGTYPNASSTPNFQLNSFDSLRSGGYYDGAVAVLSGGQADAFDSPDDEGPQSGVLVAAHARDRSERSVHHRQLERRAAGRWALVRRGLHVQERRS